MREILTLCLLFELPFLIVPMELSPYEVPKVIGALIFIGVLVLFSFPNFLKKIKTLKFFFFLLLVFLSVYHLVFPKFPDHLLWGNAWRPQGTYFYLSLFLLFLIAPKLPNNLLSKISTFVLPILLIATLLIGPQEAFRFMGPLGEPSSLGIVVLFLFPLSLLSRSKRFRIISIVCSAVLVILTGSRAVILGFMAECLILFLKTHKKLFISGTILLLFLYILSFTIPLLPRQLPAEYFLRFESRADIWTISYLAGFDSPFLGTGFGSIQDVIKFKAASFNNLLQYQSTDSAHNIFLNWWITGGALGVLTILALVIISAKNLIQKKAWTYLAILLGLLAVQSFNPVSAASLVQFWWLLGISFSVSDKTT